MIVLTIVLCHSSIKVTKTFVSVCRPAKERAQQSGKASRGRAMDRNERAPDHAGRLAADVTVPLLSNLHLAEPAWVGLCH